MITKRNQLNFMNLPKGVNKDIAIQNIDSAMDCICHFLRRTANNLGINDNDMYMRVNVANFTFNLKDYKFDIINE